MAINLQELDFNLGAWRSGADMFPLGIASRRDVLFHGTSEQWAEAIEREGLRPAPSCFEGGDVSAVVEVFQRLNWHGIDTGGYAVLGAFSIGDHCSPAGPRGAALALHSDQSALYATRDWAGGESCRAMRAALIDLEVFCSEPGVRAEHVKRQIRAADGDIGARVVDPEPILPWLESRLRSLEPLRSRVNASLARHTHGLVYAVKVEGADRAKLEVGGYTVWWRDGVPADRLIAKVEIPAWLSHKHVSERRFDVDEASEELALQKLRWLRQ